MTEAGKRLVEEWRSAGVNKGDVLLVHSSLRRLLRRYLKSGVRLMPEAILDSFLSAIGEEGTLLLPLFNFDFSEGVAFDMRSTPSHMGVLTEMGRQHPRAVRTGHPIYSFSVIGAQAHRFVGVDNFSGYGADSPFAILRELGGRIGVLDLPDQNSMTFYHHVEEMLEVPYRYHKTFEGDYADLEGNTSRRKYGLFVRDLERGVQTAVNGMGELLWEQGLYSGDRPGEGSGLRTIDSNAMFRETEKVIRSGKAEGLLYRIARDET